MQQKCNLKEGLQTNYKKHGILGVKQKLVIFQNFIHNSTSQIVEDSNVMQMHAASFSPTPKETNKLF